MKKQNLLKILIGCVAVASLMACGTEDEITLADGNPTPDAFKPAGSKATLQGPIAQAAYGDPNVQAAFEILNGARGRCGFGYWHKDGKLEQSAVNHTKYMIANNEIAHTETPGKPEFTGAEVRDRAYFAGFDARYNQGELVAWGGPAQDLAKGLLAATYHLGGVIAATQKVGMTAGVFKDGTYILTIDTADTNYLGQKLAVNTVETYPCQGESVATSHTNESPSPLPGRAASTYGPPFALRARDDLKIDVTSYSISAGGSPIQTTLVTADNDSSGLVHPNSSYVLPLQPLSSGVTYTFDASGTVNGVPFSKHYTVVAR